MRLLRSMFDLATGARQRLFPQAVPTGRRGLRTRAGRRRRPVAAAPERLESRLALAQTVGLSVYDSTQSFAGYTLFGNSFNAATNLVDNSGQLVHSWTGSGGQTSSYILENGDLLRNTIVPAGQRVFGSNGATGRIEQLDWNSSQVWKFELNSARYQLHHDAIRLPNGNVLAIAWERHLADEAVAMGRDPALLNPATNRELWSEAIFEIRPDYVARSGGEIVWEWHLKDHLVQNRYPGRPNYGGLLANPQLVNLNYVPTGIGADTHIADWAHFNAIAYNATTDQIIVSSREFCEIWVIDHSTTTAQAASHSGGTGGRGGDLLWRYGNLATWNAGTRVNQQLFFQHNAQWIAPGLPGAGNILVFNNGWNRVSGQSFSSVMELRPTGYGRAQLVWNYAATPPSAFFSAIVSGAQRLPNGNTLIDEGTTGRIFEVTRNGSIVWQYVNPDTLAGTLHQGASPSLVNIAGLNGTPNVRSNLTFRALRYAPSYAGFSGKTLTPQGTREIPLAPVSSVGFYNAASRTWSLNNRMNGSVTDVIRVGAGLPAGVPLTGDWNGDGSDTPGVYVPATKTFHLDNDNDGAADVTVVVPDARPTWLPIAGDWDGDGRAEVGFYAPIPSIFLFYGLTGQQVSSPFRTPPPAAGSKPIVGDWNGDGKDTVGLYDPIGHVFTLFNRIDGSPAGRVAFVTPPVPSNWLPVAGDWNRDGVDTVGLYAPETQTFYLNNRLDGTATDLLVFALPAGPTWVPLAGRWRPRS